MDFFSIIRRSARLMMLVLIAIIFLKAVILPNAVDVLILVTLLLVGFAVFFTAGPQDR